MGQETLTFTASMMDRILHSRLSLPENSQPSAVPLFDYLVDCWKRCGEALKRVAMVKEKIGLLEAERTGNLVELCRERCMVISEARQLVVSYSGLVITPGVAESFLQRDELSFVYYLFIYFFYICLKRKLFLFLSDVCANEAS